MNVLTMIVAGRMIAAVCSVLSALWLAARGLDGWGWFLFVAAILGTVTGTTKSNKVEEA